MEDVVSSGNRTVQLYHVENPDNHVSYGSFLRLRPFYVRNVSLKDMEMCCCKLHLHGRWCVKAIVNIASKLKITFPAINYDNFFQLIYADCGDVDDTYIPWACTPNKKVVCGDISQNYTALTKPLETADESVTISFTQFEKQVTHDSKGKVVLTKQGKPAKRLVHVKQQVNSTYLV